MARSNRKGVACRVVGLLAVVLAIAACAGSTDPSSTATKPDTATYTLVSIDGAALPTAGFSAGRLLIRGDTAFGSLQLISAPPTNGNPAVGIIWADVYVVTQTGTQVVLKSWTSGILPDTGTISPTELDLRVHVQPGSPVQLLRYVVQ